MYRVPIPCVELSIYSRIQQNLQFQPLGEGLPIVSSKGIVESSGAGAEAFIAIFMNPTVYHLVKCTWYQVLEVGNWTHEAGPDTKTINEVSQGEQHCSETHSEYSINNMENRHIFLWTTVATTSGTHPLSSHCNKMAQSHRSFEITLWNYLAHHIALNCTPRAVLNR